jgi:heparanase
LIAHNTLAASDYGLLDEKTFAPRPNYWGALLWRRLMGTTVLNAGPAPQDDVYVYAHCQRGHPGGVTVLAINAGKSARELKTPVAGERYTLSARQLESATVELNGRALSTSNDGSLPPLPGVATRAGTLTLPPESITFVAVPKAGNQSCK